MSYELFIKERNRWYAQMDFRFRVEDTLIEVFSRYKFVQRQTRHLITNVMDNQRVEQMQAFAV